MIREKINTNSIDYLGKDFQTYESWGEITGESKDLYGGISMVSSN